MLINVGLTFVTALLTLYSMFRYTLQQNDFFRYLFTMHISFLMYCLVALILIIYIANTLTNEVWNKSNLFSGLVGNLLTVALIFQSKHIAWIAQDITNSCNDTDVVLSVCIKIPILLKLLCKCLQMTT